MARMSPIESTGQLQTTSRPAAAAPAQAVCRVHPVRFPRFAISQTAAAPAAANSISSGARGWR